MAESMAIFWLIISDFGGSLVCGRLREGGFGRRKGGAGGRGLIFCLAASPPLFLVVVVVFWWVLNENGLLDFNFQSALAEVN